MEFVNNDGKIPAAEWFEALLPLMDAGYSLKICPAGVSMVPFLRGGRDEAVLSVPGEGYVIKKNDIVLYRIENGAYVLHRVCRVGNGRIYALGDGNVFIEGPICRAEIIAVADYIIRKGRMIRNDCRAYILLVNIWRLLRPLRPFLIKGYSIIWRALKNK